MNNVIEKENIKIENMSYEIRGKKVMLNSEVVDTKCDYYFYDSIINIMILINQYQHLINF